MRSALEAAIHDYIDPISYGIHNLSQLIERCARAIELSPAMVGQYNAGAADLNRAFCICHRHDALEAELAIPEADHLSHIIPVHGRVQHLREITTDRHCAAAHLDVFVQLRQFEPFVSDVVDAPHRFDRELKHSAKRQPEWNGKSGSQIS